VVGGSVVGGAVVGGAVVGGAVVGGAVVGGAVVGGAVVGGGGVGDGTPGTGFGAVGGVGSVAVIGLMDSISPPMPETSGTPAGPGSGPGVVDRPVRPPPDPPPPRDGGREVRGDGLSDAPATALKRVQPGPQGPWSLTLNTSSRPIMAATVQAQARSRRRADGPQLTR
jgi:hypothetical protein